MGKLHGQAIPNLPNGRHSDGAGLYLAVAPTSSRSWVLRVTVADGRRVERGLGGYPAVSLAQARRAADKLREELSETGDPVRRGRGRPRAERVPTPEPAPLAPGVPTFAEAAAEVHRLNLPRWRNGHAAREWLRSLERYVMPTFGHKRLDEVTRAEVLGVLLPHWHAKTETMRRVRQRVRAVFAWAQAFDYIEHNPAGDAIEAALPKLPAVKHHQRAIEHAEVPEAMATVERTGASLAVKLCLRFVVLTATRSGEARLATWGEVDMAAAEWTVPAERMKAGKPHRVPLSRQALDVLAQARALSDGEPDSLIFPSATTGRALRSDSLVKLLRENGVESSVHGFRSSFRTWALETTTAPWAVAEAALAHTIGANGTERAYIRSTLLEQRRALMADWADYVTATSGPEAKAA